MNITELNTDTEQSLQSFKQKEYSILDKERYGNDAPNFTPKEITLVMKEGGDILGFITIVIKAGITYIDSLLVAAEHRNKGVGKQLVAEAEEKARQLGSHKIWLETGVDWPAESFYKKLGYKTRCVLPNDVGNKDCLLMDKML
jgi:GNAT superfamily N-acetyltransferase